MAMKVQDPLPMLAAQVNVHGYSVVITHYQWASKKRVQVTFFDDFDLTHQDILDRVSRAMA